MSQTLRDALRPHFEGRWSAFADSHPHLAEAIDRIRLEDAVVESVRDDAAFASAMREADLDEATLAAAAKALDRGSRVIEKLLPF
ncbi:MAG: hypothetical protein GVY27_08995 [Deinococcus-Thermus bacterium]|jgi:hypothetical protein|nr:hypothetical protein [Deinococcota bacterium]